MTEVTQAEFARYRQVSRKTVSVWKAQGYLVLFPTGKVDVRASDKKLAGRPDVNRGGVTKGLPSVTLSGNGADKCPQTTIKAADTRPQVHSGGDPVEDAVFNLLLDMRHVATHAAVQAGASPEIAFAVGWIAHEIALNFAADVLHFAGLPAYEAIDDLGSLTPGQITMAADLKGGNEPVWGGILPAQAAEIENWTRYRDALPWWREHTNPSSD